MAGDLRTGRPLVSFLSQSAIVYRLRQVVAAQPMTARANRQIGEAKMPVVPSSCISRRTLLATIAVLPILPGLALLISKHALAQTDPPLSCNEGAAAQAILSCVAAVTREGSPDFVPAPQRIATFDNDGTLWVEQPMYTQLAFALDRVKALSDQHPEWTDKQPFKAVLENDMAALAEAGYRGFVELVIATHAG